MRAVEFIFGRLTLLRVDTRVREEIERERELVLRLVVVRVAVLLDTRRVLAMHHYYLISPVIVVILVNYVIHYAATGAVGGIRRPNSVLSQSP